MPDFSIENELDAPVVGIDEVGRGALCGPVCAAAVILNRNDFPKGLEDSKKLTESRREKLFEIITEYEDRGVLFYGFASVDAPLVDIMNIRKATLLAMKLAFENLIKKYDITEDSGNFTATNVKSALVDGRDAPPLPIRVYPVIRADQKSRSVACASIIAKVTRDRELRAMHKKYPQYGWDKNKGYGTLAHRKAIEKYGLVENYHRKTFCRGFCAETTL